MQTRPIHEISAEILTDWKKVNYAAKPYLAAMHSIDSIDSNYHCDTAKSVVLYFLSNASSWRGDVARRVKKELNSICK